MFTQNDFSRFLIKIFVWSLQRGHKNFFWDIEPEVFYKKSCSKNFCNIHRKTPVVDSLFNKVTGLKACNWIKKRLQLRYFPVNIEILKKTYFEEYLRILLLRDNSKWRENLLNLDVSCYITGLGIKRKQGPPFAATILILHNSKKPTFWFSQCFWLKMYSLVFKKMYSKEFTSSFPNMYKYNQNFAFFCVSCSSSKTSPNIYCLKWTTETLERNGIYI